MKYRIEIEVSPEVEDLLGLAGTIGYVATSSLKAIPGITNVIVTEMLPVE